MSYLVLARKLRPSRFKDVVGQDHIWKTLINAIETDRVAHAFLFTGPRGTGKTSCARILTKALNCQSPIDYEPCNQCENCIEINKGISADVMEIDAASNRGIEHIRELRDGVKFSPAKCRYKTYIIDEVHMLTTESFNALLKTLEEPPSHVKFILATTDPHKIPTTVISRCQRYDFTNISIPAMVDYLKTVAEHEQIKISVPALRIIAGNSAGGMRDALTTMDMLISFSGNEISDESVAEILGVNDYKEIDQLLEAIVRKDLGNALAQFQKLIGKGRSLTQFIADLMKSIKNLSLVKSLPSNQLQWYDFLPDQEKKYAELAANTTVGTLQQYFNILLDVEIQIKRSAQAKVCIEMGIMKLCSVESLVGVGEFIAALRDSKIASKRGLAPSINLVGHVKPQKPAIPNIAQDASTIPESTEKLAESSSDVLKEQPKEKKIVEVASPPRKAERTDASVSEEKSELSKDPEAEVTSPVPSSENQSVSKSQGDDVETKSRRENNQTAIKGAAEAYSEQKVKDPIPQYEKSEAENSAEEVQSGVLPSIELKPPAESQSTDEDLKREAEVQQHLEKEQIAPSQPMETTGSSMSTYQEVVHSNEEPPDFFSDVPALGSAVAPEEPFSTEKGSETIKGVIAIDPEQKVTPIETPVNNELAPKDNGLDPDSPRIEGNDQEQQESADRQDGQSEASERERTVAKWKGFVDRVAENNNKSLVSLLRNAILLKLTEETLEIGYSNLEVFNRDKKVEIANLARTYFNPGIKVFYKSQKTGIDDSLKRKDDAAAAKRIAERIESAKTNPVVSRVLENFPGSQIKKVTIIEELENDR